MATVNYDLNSSIDFPALTKRCVKRLYKRKRKRRCEENDNYDTRSRINDLNDTLLELIFIKLSPWKYLVTSKCVSKRWNSIISNPYFLRSLTREHYPFTLLLRVIDRYTSRSGQCLISEHPHFRKNKLHLRFVDDIIAQNNDVVVSCHVFGRSEDLIEYCIANPLTKKYVVIPLPIINPLHYYDHRTVGIAGVVDGVSSVAINSNRGFRIVRIIKELPFLVQIFSSETSQWTTYLFKYYINIHIRATQAVTLNNKVHWLMEYTILVIDPFDIDILPPYKLSLPIGCKYEGSVLGVCQNRLRIARLQEKQGLKVWEDENDNNETNYNLAARAAKWRLVIDIPPLKTSIHDLERQLSPIDRLFPIKQEFYYEEKVVCCHPNDPNVVYFVYKKELYSYDAFTQRFKVVSHCTSDWSERFVFVHPLMAS